MSDSKLAVIIDDDPFIRELLKNVLSNLGYETRIYNCALDVPCTHGNCEEKCLVLDPPPEILITDIKMPGMSGIELLHKISEKHCRVKTIAVMSGYWEDETRREAERLGCKQLDKPFTLDDIKELTEKVS